MCFGEVCSIFINDCFVFGGIVVKDFFDRFYGFYRRFKAIHLFLVCVGGLVQICDVRVRIFVKTLRGAVHVLYIFVKESGITLKVVGGLVSFVQYILSRSREGVGDHMFGLERLNL